MSHDFEPTDAQKVIDAVKEREIKNIQIDEKIKSLMFHSEKPLFKAEDIKIRDNFKSEYWVDIDVDYATIDEAEQVREVLLKLTDTHL